MADYAAHLLFLDSKNETACAISPNGPVYCRGRCGSDSASAQREPDGLAIPGDRHLVPTYLLHRRGVRAISVPDRLGTYFFNGILDMFDG